MGSDSSDAIQVNRSSVPDQAATVTRFVVAAIGAFALGRHLIADDTLQLVTSLSMVGVPLAWAWWKTWDNKRKLVVTASAAPDDVAVVKD